MAKPMKFTKLVKNVKNTQNCVLMFDVQDIPVDRE